TPTSSSTSVNDTRGKTPDNAQFSSAPQGTGQGNNGPATPTKGSAPSVVISPSAVSRITSQQSTVATFTDSLGFECDIASPPTWCGRDHARRFGTSPEIQCFRSSPDNAKRHVGRDSNSQAPALVAIRYLRPAPERTGEAPWFP